MMRSRNVIVKAATVLTMSSIEAARASSNMSRTLLLGAKHAASFSHNSRGCYIDSRHIAVCRFSIPLHERGRFIHSSGTRRSRQPESIPSIQSDDEESLSIMQLSDLSVMMKESYRSSETDGVQAALKSNNILDIFSAKLDAKEVASRLIGAAVEAAGRDRGVLAAIINSVMASCCGDEDGDVTDENPSSAVHPEISLAMLDLVDEMHSTDPSAMVTPDIVSLSLAYYALNPTSSRVRHHGIVKYALQSNILLERARRMAKKAAGSQRRRALASERRKGGNSADDGVDATRTEARLQSLCGPDIRVLYETPDVIVVSKPSGMVCYHSKSTGSGAKRTDISLVEALVDCSVPLSTLNPSARGIVHRLDRGTSGSIVLAKTDEIHLRLIALFFLHGRPARSSYRVTKVFGNEISSPDALLLEVSTLTGRKHQVRVHCASLGHPIFLDPMYASYPTLEGSSKGAEKGQKKRRGSSMVKTDAVDSALPKAVIDTIGKFNNQRERFFLHAASLTIKEVGITVNAPLPQWWVDTIEQLN
ncbi:hypothetical protein ACHAW5_009390 [Stephanodiscus triporus]|uniref:Pseudouridine synthase RsuA/RluA-like domain-containing protein n=1 Tax=Stephanodiscus triporus TaxID=2934178 RepID=A0ABD3PKH2_9STRA